MPGYGEIHHETAPLHAELYKMAGAHELIAADLSGNQDFGLATLEYFNESEEMLTVSFINAQGQKVEKIMDVDEYLMLKRFRKSLLRQAHEQAYRHQGGEQVKEQREIIVANNLKLFTSKTNKSYRAHLDDFFSDVVQGNTGLLNRVRATFYFDRLTGEILSFGKYKEYVPVERIPDAQLGVFEIIIDASSRLPVTKTATEQGREHAWIARLDDLKNLLHRQAAEVLSDTIFRFNQELGTDYSLELRTT